MRTVAVTFEPIAPERSTREVEAAITRDRADRELRHRFGQSETARQRQAQEAAVRREAELAAGHAEVRLAGFVTVSRPRSTTTCAAPARRSTSRRLGPGSSCTACTASRPMRSRSRCRSAGGCDEPADRRAARAPLHDPPCPGDLPVHGQRRPRRRAACSSAATRAAGRSATTRGSCTARARSTTPTRSCSASSGRARARSSRRCCGGCCCSAGGRSCSTSSASTARCARRSAWSRSRSRPAAGSGSTRSRPGPRSTRSSSCCARSP